MPGMEVKLSPEGEILARGANVAAGYWKDAGISSVLDADGWFHTGDIGEQDASGNFYFKGPSEKCNRDAGRPEYLSAGSRS